MKIVINACYGGFALSPAGIKMYLKLKGKDVYFYKELFGDEEGYERKDNLKEINNDKFIYAVFKDFGPHTDDLFEYPTVIFSSMDISRDDPDLITVVETLGDLAGKDFSKLKIIEIPDDVEWEIDVYDGFEWVAEKHRTWR